MNFAKEARQLVNYIECLDTFNIIDIPNKPSYSHIGGLFTDIVLQTGLNYNNIVKPRVLKIINHYPDAYNVKGFSKIIENKGLSELINWKHPTKLQRIINLITFAKINNIDTCNELRVFLTSMVNRSLLLEINGFGPKTLDYALKLLNFDTVAVDRHIASFVKRAGINIQNYYHIKSIVEYAADFMNISRTSIDYSIWRYMSSGEKVNYKWKYYSNDQIANY